MSIGTPNGILDITGATLRVSKMEFRQSTGFDTVLNNVARNTMLLMDETEQTTSNSWALKLPNAWVAEFHGYWASGSSGAPILFNFYNDSTSGTNGYTLSMNDTTISINYDGGSTLGSATLSSTLNNDTYRKVAVIFERSVLDVSVDGEHVFHFADSQLRDRVYDNNSGYVTFAHSSTDGRKLKNLKFTNGDKWIREIDSSNIAYVGGNVGIGTTIPGTKLDVSGTVRGTHLIGDGSAISAIQSSNVSDFGSNVTRIGTLETDLGDNSSRITNLSSNLSDNSSRITALESGDISISGDKTFTGDIIFESNIHMNGGNVLVANTVNMTVSDPIIELGLNNIGTNDLGIIMTRPAANSNVAFVYDESDDILRMGYTLNGASDSIVDLDSNALAVSVQGDLEVGTANLFVDTSTSRVGIGTDSPAYTLDVHGSSNVGALTTTSVSGDGSGITNILSSSVNDFSSNVTRISNLETDLGSNVTRIGTLESGDMTIGGEKTFSSNLQVGTANLFVDTTTGNVGVGTTSPATPFNINKLTATVSPKAHTTTEFIRLRGDKVIGQTYAISGGIKLGGDTGGTATADGRIEFYANDGADPGNSYGDVPDNFIMCMRGDSKVGIGTTSPNGNLHIMSDLANASSQINPSAQLVLHSSLAGLDDDGDIGASLVFTQRWLDSSPNSHGTMGSIHGFKDLSAGNYGGGLLFKTQPGSDTAPVERMRIDRDGNVGIGLTSPVYTLDVNGVSRSRGVCVNSGFGNGTARPALTTGSTHPSYEIRSIGGNGNVGGAGADDGFLRLRAGGGTGTNSASYIDLSGYSTYSGGDMKRNIVFGTLGTERMRIKENGNVGIGTTSPSGTLHVNGDNIYISSPTVSNCTWRILPQTGNTTKLFRIYDHNNASDRLVIDASGNVGIGTVSPDEKLDINGGNIKLSVGNSYGTDRYIYTHWEDSLNDHQIGLEFDYYTGSGGTGTTHSRINFISNATRDTVINGTGKQAMMSVLSNGNVGIGTTSPAAKLHIETSSTSSGSVMRVDASSVTNTGYSEIQMVGPGQTSQGLSIFCNGSGRTTDGGASATTVRNNNGPIILGSSSYVNRIRKPKDDDFICGKWTTTLDASAATTVITNLRSCVSTPSAGGTNMSGNIGRFTAPEDGYYFACCQVDNAARNNSNLLIIYEAGGTDFATNNPDVGTYSEIIDLRSADNVEETYNKVFVMHMKQNNYIQFRVHSSGYIESSSRKMQCYAYLLNRI